MAEVVVELLDKRHGRKAFDCGQPEETEFLRQRARKHADLGYSRTWVAVEAGSLRVLGYVTLSMGQVSFESLDEALRARLPRYPMPTLHVGRLATDVEYQGKGIGSLLLRLALTKAMEASASVGCYAVELVARNDKALAFYLRLGFRPPSEGSMRLYLPVSILGDDPGTG